MVKIVEIKVVKISRFTSRSGWLPRFYGDFLVQRHLR